MTDAYDLIVIGSGPAGQSAAELADSLLCWLVRIHARPRHHG